MFPEIATTEKDLPWDFSHGRSIILLNILQRQQILLSATLTFGAIIGIGTGVNLVQIFVMIMQYLFIFPSQHHNANGTAVIGSTLQMG